MSSATLDSKFRKIGYFLVRRDSVDGKYWFVGSQNTHNGYNASNLKEAKSLLSAISEQQDSGGTIIHDGVEYVCAA